VKNVASVAIIGIGNILLGDDGIGPYVVRVLDANYEFGPNVQILDVGTPALDFIDNLIGIDAVILVDSVEDERPAGTITLYRKEDILRHGVSVRMDPHSPALAESLMTADMLGIGPKELLLIGISAASYDAGCELSPEVKRAVDLAIDVVRAELRRLDVPYYSASRQTKPDIWWASSPAASTSGHHARRP
jgi:hydrogenase maturation protease